MLVSWWTQIAINIDFEFLFGFKNFSDGSDVFFFFFFFFRF